ncbi:hypothetical protein [Streptomyces sp. WAC05858]|uniref:hypothetical protein n=1 Tax=Streptomyces TaxID=1883 RepID=UPI000F7A1E19|nr:hypothetical protein [Streptomyces sp. WAC05858]RSS34197.1 hypothetical protein EF902_41450 [Streptomyces sp. WAC05858]
MDTNAAEYEVRTAGTADYILRNAGFFSRMPVICLECDARTGLTLTARGEDTSITCPQGHTTVDRRLTPEAVRDVAARAADAGVDVVPADAEIWFRARTETKVLPELEDIAYLL